MTDHRYARRAEVPGESVYAHSPGAIVRGSGPACAPHHPRHAYGCAGVEAVREGVRRSSMVQGEYCARV